jgi:shikimate dehydrogenase
MIAGRPGALVLGTGGAALAVRHALLENALAAEVAFVSRNPAMPGAVSYEKLNDRAWSGRFRLIVNATPVGMHPGDAGCPPIPFERIGEGFTLIDLVYNPAETVFLRRGRENGAAVCNGMPMLERQAELSWEIWNARDYD